MTSAAPLRRLTAITAILIVLLGLEGCSQPTGGSPDRGAQSNLTNALTEADALYQTGGKAFTGGVTGLLPSSAPEFAWTQGACGSTPWTCISFHVYSAVTNGDDQVLMLADRQVNLCWYILEVEQPPGVQVEQPPSLPIITGHGPHELDVQQAGVFYARSSTRGGKCAATDPVAESFHHWFGTYSSVVASN